MFANARLLLTAAALAASVSLALAPSAPFDDQDDKPLSYGPPSPSRAAPTANPAQGPVGQDAFHPSDPTDDKVTSYGVRN